MKNTDKLEVNELTIACRIAGLYLKQLDRVAADIGMGKPIEEALKYSPAAKQKLVDWCDEKTMAHFSRDKRTKPRANEVLAAAHRAIKAELDKRPELVDVLQKVRAA